MFWLQITFKVTAAALFVVDNKLSQNGGLFLT